MGSEYNSNLISKLYQAIEEEKILNILADMGDIGDPIFLHPILDGYKKHKDSYFSHYFLGALGQIKSENTGKYLNELLEKGEVKKSDIDMVLNIMGELGYYTPTANALAGLLLREYSSPEFKKSLHLDEWGLGFLLEYLKKSGVIYDHREDIRSLLSKENLNREERAVALKYLLRIKADEELDYLIANYPDKINKDAELELIVAKELLGWKGKKVEQLKDLIISSGQERAKEILRKEREEKLQSQIKEEKITQQKESIIYGNSRIVKEIVDIRKYINRKTESSQNFLYQLFPDDELLLVQIESADNESSFVDSCVKLRPVVQNVSKEVQNHGLNEETIKSLLPDTERSDTGKSLNQLYLYLKSKNINTDPNLFELKLLNKILSLVGHPEAEKELRELLSKINALEMYDKKEWPKIHQYLLGFYRRCLEKLSGALT